MAEDVNFSQHKQCQNGPSRLASNVVSENEMKRWLSVNQTNSKLGWWLGALGVMIFSQTLPMTKLALVVYPAEFVGFFRSAVAGLFAIVILMIWNSTRPTRANIFPLFISGLCVAIGFPVLTSLGLRSASSSHGAVVIGIIPIFTAFFSTRGRGLPRVFWISSIVGSLTVIAFVLKGSEGHFNWADAFFVIAAIVVAYGYALGGRLSMNLGGWRVVCWSLILCLPLTIPLAFYFRPSSFMHSDVPALIGLMYVTLLSQLLGFFAWYAGLALGGAAGVSQIQLLQGFLTIAGSSIYLGEKISSELILFLLTVVASIYFSRRALRNQKTK